MQARVVGSAFTGRSASNKGCMVGSAAGRVVGPA